MKKLLLVTGFSLIATTAYAEIYRDYDGDRGYRNEIAPGEGTLRRPFNVFEGRSAYDECRILERRMVTPDGEEIISRQPVCE